MSAAPPHSPARIKVVRRPGRVACAGLAAALLASAIALIGVWDAAWWQTVAFALGGAASLYHALHRFWGPLALAVAARAAGLPLGYGAGAIAWGLHVAFDRAIGLRPRSPDGFQRAESW